MAKQKTGSKSLFSKNIGKSSGKRVTKYPEKTSINLVRYETEKSNTMDLLVMLLIVVLLAAFGKFFVYDEFDKLSRAQHQYGAVQDQLTELRQANARYDDVKKAYDSVTEWYLTDEEKKIIDKTEVIAMLEQDLMPYVELMRVQVTGTTVAVETGETTLPVVSKFLLILQEDPRNLTATVTTTAAASQIDGEERVKASVIIQFIGKRAEAEAADKPSKEELAKQLLGDDYDASVLGGAS